MLVESDETESKIPTSSDVIILYLYRLPYTRAQACLNEYGKNNALPGFDQCDFNDTRRERITRLDFRGMKYRIFCIIDEAFS
jgi:hypothetical protein